MKTDGVLPLCGYTVYSLRVKAAAFYVDCGRDPALRKSYHLYFT